MKAAMFKVFYCVENFNTVENKCLILYLRTFLSIPTNY
jgi:hypothetical protein